VFCCSSASAVNDVGLKRQRLFLNGSNVPHMRPACGIAVAVQELEVARNCCCYAGTKGSPSHGYIYIYIYIYAA
jgi:hypothetical protein